MEKVYDLYIENNNPFGKNVENDLNFLLQTGKSRISDFDEELIKKAFYFCVEGHSGKARISGSPFYTHPLKVAISLMEEFQFCENITIAAALIHDTVEDVDSVTIEKIREIFGEPISKIVDGVTKIKGVRTQALDKAHTYGKLFAALVQDIRVIIIKLADRLDNLRSLQHLKLRKQKVIAEETLNFYIPFAQRLGLTRIKRDLEDLSLYYSDREAYDSIRPALDKKRLEFVELMTTFINQISQKLDDNEVKYILTIEHKHVFEIYKMMTEQHKKLSDIDNFYSIVIVLPTNDFTQCYRIYGLVASVFGPVDSLDDYISRPKVNFYRALHSKHIGPGNKTVEVIIRTEEMDKIAEGGISALFSIKDYNRTLILNEEGVDNWVKWMQDIIADDDPDAIQKIWGSIKMNLYEDEIIVYNTDGQSFHLPKGSCPIDFAFSLSEQVGIHCISAKVNGEIKSLDYELKSNDFVEIISSSNSFPSLDWQQHIVSHKAIVGLYNYFKNNISKINIKSKKSHNSFVVKILINGEDKPGMLNEITQIIGKINILRINLNSSDSMFEGALTLNVDDSNHFNEIFTKLLTIKGIKGIERVDVEE